MGDARRKDSMSLAEHIWYINTASWFNHNLDNPTCFDRPALGNVGLQAQSWFKYKISAHLEKSLSVVKLLRKHGVSVNVKLTGNPGKIIYEDELQVVALPVSELDREAIK